MVEDAAGGLCALAWGTVRTSSSQPQVRLKHIYDGLSEALHTWQPEAVAVERVFFAENPKTALILGHARGVALLTVANAALPLVEYSALEIKQAVVGYGRAGKRRCSRWCARSCAWTRYPNRLTRRMPWQRRFVTCTHMGSGVRYYDDCPPARRISGENC